MHHNIKCHIIYYIGPLTIQIEPMLVTAMVYFYTSVFFSSHTREFFMQTV